MAVRTTRSEASLASPPARKIGWLDSEHFGTIGRVKPWVYIAVGSAFILGGCFYPASRGKLLEERVDKLQSDNDQLSAQLRDTQAKLAATLPKVDEKITEVANALEGLDRASRRSGADAGVQLQKTIEDVAQLRGEVEKYVNKISELENALKKYRDESDLRFAEARGPDALKAMTAKKKSEELQKPSDKRQFLALAHEKLAAGDSALARQLYSEFTQKWDRDPLAGEAHFGLGESYFAEGKCPEALFEYRKVLQDYLKSKSVPTAYLHSAECFKKLKMLPEARLALDEVVKSYPKSEAAHEAKTRLAELNKLRKSAPKKGKN